VVPIKLVYLRRWVSSRGRATIGTVLSSGRGPYQRSSTVLHRLRRTIYRGHPDSEAVRLRQPSAKAALDSGATITIHSGTRIVLRADGLGRLAHYSN